MDIDHFKDVNDKYGHEAGDIVLKDIANLMLNFFRKTDICCRYGGEEMLIILYDSNIDNALDKIELFRKNIANLKFSFVELFSVTASFGISEFPKDGEDAESLIKAADAALYQSKNNGRNRVTVFDSPNKISKTN